MFVVVDGAKLCIIWEIGNFFGNFFLKKFGLKFYYQSNQQLTKEKILSQNRYLIGIIPKILSIFAHLKDNNQYRDTMKKKFLSALEIKCKDMGLTKNALNELTDIGAKSLKDDATDDDINAAVDSLVPYAKAMQAETTRKTSRKPSTAQSTENGEGNGEGESTTTGGEKPGNEMPEWAKAMQTQLNSLASENAALKAEKAKSERAATIAEKAKTIGIPEYIVKRMTFADDADLDAELTSLKQDLVNNNLMPKGHAHEGGSTEAQDIADAEAWAKTLSNRE